jgi:hypothetical protein
VSTDASAATLAELAQALVAEIAGDADIGARCKALAKRVFSPEVAVKQIVAALQP